MLAVKGGIVLCVSAGGLELRYKLQSGRDAEVLWSRVPNVADGRLHTATIRRVLDAVSVQVIALQSIAVASTVTVKRPFYRQRGQR